MRDPELAAVIDAWPGLPEPIRVGIVAMVWAGAKGRPTGDAGNDDSHVGGTQPGGAS